MEERHRAVGPATKKQEERNTGEHGGTFIFMDTYIKRVVFFFPL